MPTPTAPQDDLKKLLASNLEISKQILELNQKIYRAMIWGRIWAIAKIIIIAVPIILGIIYLPPLLGEVLAPYRDLLEFNQELNTQDILGQFNR